MFVGKNFPGLEIIDRGCGSNVLLLCPVSIHLHSQKTALGEFSQNSDSYLCYRSLRSLAMKPLFVMKVRLFHFPENSYISQIFLNLILKHLKSAQAPNIRNIYLTYIIPVLSLANTVFPQIQAWPVICYNSSISLKNKAEESLSDRN